MLKLWNLIWYLIGQLTPPLFCAYHGHEWQAGPTRFLRTRQRVCKRCLTVEPL